MKHWDAAPAAVLALTAALLAGCEPESNDGGHQTQVQRDNFRCDVHEDRTQDALDLPFGFNLQTGVSADRTSAVEFDPNTGRSTYVATIIDSVHGSAGVSRLVRSLRPELSGVGVDLDAHVDQQVGVGFVYRQKSQADAEKLARSTIPPAGWNKLIIRLTTTAAGSATAQLGEVLSGEIGTEGYVRAELTLEDNGRYSITRTWGGEIHAEAQAWIRERVGAPLESGWHGSMETEYTEVFGPDRRPLALTTTGTVSIDSTIRKTVRRLDLTQGSAQRTVDQALPGGGVGDAFSAGQVFFLNPASKLWKQLMAGPAIRTEYVDDGISHLSLGAYGVAYSHDHTFRRATGIEVIDAKGTRKVTCTGIGDQPNLAGAPVARPISEDQVPKPPAISPKRPDTTPTGTPGSEAPQSGAPTPTDTTEPSMPPEPTPEPTRPVAPVLVTDLVVPS